MRCPTLTELPPPPPGRTGWPWTEESPQLPDTMPDGRPWPRVSIATPSYNQAQFIEETIRSVLLQGYPDLEYIIIDGGSTDGSVEIIRKYAPWLAFWVSEPDRGQSHAINKGWRKATGQYLAWLNSDDVYFAGFLQSAARYLSFNPHVPGVYGGLCYLSSAGDEIRREPARPYLFEDVLRSGAIIPQQSALLARHVIEAVGDLNEDLHYAMDWEFWLRVTHRFYLQHLEYLWAGFRLASDSKTATQLPAFWQEELQVLEQLFSIHPELLGMKSEVCSQHHFRIGLGYVFLGQNTLARDHLREALSAGCPFRTLQETAEYAVAFARKPIHQPLEFAQANRIVNEMVKIFSQINRELAGCIAEVRTFEAYNNKRFPDALHFGVQALYLSRISRRNRGLWTTVARSVKSGLIVPNRVVSCAS